MLLANELTKHYGKVEALNDVTIEFTPGLYGLLAPNGAGKTTLIKALTTLITPTRGEVLYDGVDITVLDEEYRALLGYLPQEFGYYRGYTARQFLRYLAALQGIGRREVEDRVAEVLGMVALTDAADRRLRGYSGGMLQRVGIAQAMLNDPKLLILDEPTAGLDPKERVRFRNLLSSLARDRIVILSSHIVSDIEHIATTVVLLDRGRLIAADSPAGILAPLAGRVFETTDAGDLGPDDLLLTERHDADGVHYRFLPAQPPTGVASVPATLEDVFLSTYRDAA